MFSLYFLPQSKDLQIGVGLIGDTLAVGVNGGM